MRSGGKPGRAEAVLLIDVVDRCREAMQARAGRKDFRREGKNMAARMEGAQKAAVLLLAMGEQAASEVIKNLSEDEINAVTPYMTRFSEITPGDVARVANEFYRIAEKGRFLPAAPETKTAYLKKVLEKALGAEKTGGLIEGLLASDSAGPLEKLRWHDPSTIARFLGGEHPQVIAVIVANLGDPLLTQNVLIELPDGLRQDVFGRLVRLREISPEWVEEIEASLAEEMGQEHGEVSGKGASSNRVAGMLNAAPRGMEQDILEHIEGRDPGLAARIREQMFPFEDFIRIDNPSMQKVLERATNQDLVLALGTASAGLRRHFLRNLSAARAGALEEAIANFGPVRVSEIEAAQKRLSNIARELAEAGELGILAKRT
jgi:flagellar motor switch protein FliG